MPYYLAANESYSAPPLPSRLHQTFVCEAADRRLRMGPSRSERGRGAVMCKDGMADEHIYQYIKLENWQPHISCSMFLHGGC